MQQNISHNTIHSIPPNHKDHLYVMGRTEENISILIVEDDPLSMQFLAVQIEALEHKFFKAENGLQALDFLESPKNKIDIILMDREMPVMDGIKAVQKIKSNPSLRNIPIIMVTSADTTKEMREGLDAGMFYYLTKPVEPDMLRSVLAAATKEVQQNKTLEFELGQHRSSFHLIETCRFKFKKLEEAESLAAFIANCFPDPKRVLVGLGELMINAVEHGNLGIGYAQKTALIENGTWRGEIERLQSLPQNEDKFVTVTMTHKDDGTYVVIDDCGDGFDWQNYMQIDPARAADNHGRGIAQANALSFDKLVYNAKGNQAVAFVSNKKQLEW
ncbi:MAG: response regulator [Alphaproteobacteria bacterium]